MSIGSSGALERSGGSIGERVGSLEEMGERCGRRRGRQEVLDLAVGQFARKISVSSALDRAHEIPSTPYIFSQHAGACLPRAEL